MKLRILQSLGMTDGTLSPGNIAEVDDVTAEDFLRAGFAEEAAEDDEVGFVVTPGRVITKERFDALQPGDAAPADAPAGEQPSDQPVSSPAPKKGKKTK